MIGFLVPNKIVICATCGYDAWRDGYPCNRCGGLTSQTYLPVEITKSGRILTDADFETLADDAEKELEGASEEAILSLPPVQEGIKRAIAAFEQWKEDLGAEDTEAIALMREFVALAGNVHVGAQTVCDAVIRKGGSFLARLDTTRDTSSCGPSWSG